MKTADADAAALSSHLIIFAYIFWAEQQS